MVGKILFAAALIASTVFATPALADPEPDPAEPGTGGEWIALVLADSGGGFATGATEEAASASALSQCQSKGGSGCSVAEVVQDGCIALAGNEGGDFATASAPNKADANGAALAQVAGGEIGLSQCA
jgi:hypothetical protein